MTLEATRQSFGDPLSFLLNLRASPSHNLLILSKIKINKQIKIIKIKREPADLAKSHPTLSFETLLARHHSNGYYDLVEGVLMAWAKP